MSNIVAVGDHANIDAEVERIVALPYRRELLRNDDGSWFARIVELRGCMTEGDTQVEALVNLDDAMREWVRVQLEDGDSIPLPSADGHYSGKFVVRIPPALHRDLSDRAEHEGVSLNQLATSLLSRGVGASERVASQTPLRLAATQLQNLTKDISAEVTAYLSSDASGSEVGFELLRRFERLMPDATIHEVVEVALETKYAPAAVDIKVEAIIDRIRKMVRPNLKKLRENELSWWLF